MQSDASNWLIEAKNDFSVAEILLEKKKWSTSVFHSQQSAEKAIKYLIYKLNQSPWGHASSQLLRNYYELQNKEVNQDLIDCCSDLDTHYLTSRYPNGGLNIAPSRLYTEKIAKNAIECASKVIKFAEKEFA